MRRPFICGNWKMNKTVRESEIFAQQLAALLPPSLQRDVAIAPPFTALHSVALIIRNTPIRLAAQNVHDRPKGAFTGEISAPMLLDIGCQYVIVGHSERRSYFGETDEWINKKIKAVLENGMQPILCVGETLEEREENFTFSVVERQIKGGLQGLGIDGISKTIIAYEPVWAIGTGKTAEPFQAQEVHRFIRKEVEKLTSQEVANELRIIYGGSVNPSNISPLMAEEDIDGALVGGASLSVDDFLSIIMYK
ncbi:MAG: triose-phosphate isomerase [Syntrophales bacterium]|nr:triose-phosphate isomerase [Syntrophales bacterium]